MATTTPEAEVPSWTVRVAFAAPVFTFTVIKFAAPWFGATLRFPAAAIRAYLIAVFSF